MDIYTGQGIQTGHSPCWAIIITLSLGKRERNGESNGTCMMKGKY